jgi:GT2 family glycosyltransferase
VSAARPRILLAVTFYNGRDFARRTFESIARIDRDGFDIDVLVLDDCSPEPGFSPFLADLAREFGAVFYRSPRNLGIPRNVNLGLATAQRLGYDYVIISNSDVIYARNSVRVLLDVVASSPGAASATAWSTNVDPYSLPNGTELFVETAEVTDLIGDALEQRFGSEALDIPAGISFAMIVPVAVLPIVGLMDPVFGRGYGEESDWSARATSAGEWTVLRTLASIGRGIGTPRRTEVRLFVFGQDLLAAVPGRCPHDDAGRSDRRGDGGVQRPLGSDGRRVGAARPADRG